MRVTLRRRILAGYGIVLALTLVVLVWALARVHQLGVASEAILRENYRSILAAENMVDAIERQDSAVLLLLLGRHEAALPQFRANESQFLQWLGRAKDNLTIQGEGELVDDIQRGYEAYLAEFSAVELAQQGSPAGAVDDYGSTIQPSFQRVRDACIKLRQLNEEVMFEAADRARGLARRAIWSVAVVGLAALLVGLVFSVLLSARITRPVRELSRGLQLLAGGDYDVELAADCRDELGKLTDEFNQMAAQLRRYRDLHLEQTMAEQRKSAAIVGSIDDGVVVLDSQLMVTDINPSAAHILDLERAGALGRHVAEVIGDERLTERLRATTEHGTAPRLDPSECLLTIERDERTRHYQYGITLIEAGSAQPGVVLLLRDVTRLKEIERLKTEFVMTASHELRTPLASLQMCVDLLREGAVRSLSEDHQALLEAAHEEVHRLKALVNDLLDLSKLEAGQMAMDLEHVRLGTVLHKVEVVLQPQAEERGIALTAGCDEELTVVADVGKTTWVVTNLVANALRFTPAGGHITVRAERYGPHVHVAVEDDGVGIAEEHHSRIFEQFVRVGGPEDVGGTGLGLTICRAIVHAHGGTIWVDSRPGEGSTFTFTLPAAGGGAGHGE